MNRRLDLPSLPVIGVVALVLAGIVFMATRPHDDRERQVLINAVNATFQRGGTVTDTDFKSTPSIGEHTTTAEMTDVPGTDPWTLTDGRAVVRSVRAAVNVETVGTESIDGVAVTHYTAIVDDDLASEQIEQRGVDPGFDVKAVADLKVRPSQIDVWIDASGLMRRFKLEDWIDALDSFITLDFRY